MFEIWKVILFIHLNEEKEKNINLFLTLKIFREIFINSLKTSVFYKKISKQTRFFFLKKMWKL